MENKKNNGLVVAFIIVLVVAVLGIGGTLYFYNKSLNVNSKEKSIQKSIQKNTDGSKSNEEVSDKEISDNEGEKETNNEEKITIEQLKNRYEGVVAPIGGQFTPTYYRIMDK